MNTPVFRLVGNLDTPVQLAAGEFTIGTIPSTNIALKAYLPDLVEYHEWRTARHTKLWNLDRARYEREIRAWLDERGITAFA